MKQIHTNTSWDWFSQKPYYSRPRTQSTMPQYNAALRKLFYEYLLIFMDSSMRKAHNRLSQPISKTPPTQVVPFAQRIDEIRNVLAINISDLAVILDVTRPTIYKFMDGNEPVENSEEKYARIEMLQLLSQKIKESELITPGNQILRRRNQHGESLKELLEKGIATETDLDVFVAFEVQQQRENKRRAALMKKNEATQKQENPELISVPYHRE